MVFPVPGGLLWILDYRTRFNVGAGLSFASLAGVQLSSGQVRRVDQRRLSRPVTAGVGPADSNRL